MSATYRPQRKLLYLALGCAGLIFLLLIAVLSAALLYRHKIKLADADIDQRLGRIRAAGEPVTMQELAAMIPTPPDDDNAAVLLRNAFEAFREPPESNTAIPEFGNEKQFRNFGPLSEEVKRAGEAMVMQNTACLSFVDAALQRKACRFPLKYKNGLIIEPPHLDNLKDLGHLLVLKALLDAENHDTAASCDSLIKDIRLSETKRTEPVLISQLVRIAMHSTNVLGLEQVLNRAALHKEQLAELQRVLSSAQDADLMYRGLIGERCVEIGVFDLLRKGVEIDSVGNPARGDSGFFPGRATFDMDANLACMERLISASRLPFPGMMDRFGEIERELYSDGAFTSGPFFTELTRTILPSFGRAAQAAARDTAMLSIGQIALAVEQFRLAQHRLPRSLDELVPAHLSAVPMDPFDGKPLRYIRDEQGYSLYCVGQDRKDDGGKEPASPEQRWRKGDYVFSVRR